MGCDKERRLPSGRFSAVHAVVECFFGKGAAGPRAAVRSRRAVVSTSCTARMLWAQGAGSGKNSNRRRCGGRATRTLAASLVAGVGCRGAVNYFGPPWSLSRAASPWDSETPDKVHALACSWQRAVIVLQCPTSDGTAYHASQSLPTSSVQQACCDFRRRHSPLGAAAWQSLISKPPRLSASDETQTWNTTKRHPSDRPYGGPDIKDGTPRSTCCFSREHPFAPFLVLSLHANALVSSHYCYPQASIVARTQLTTRACNVSSLPTQPPI